MCCESSAHLCSRDDHYKKCFYYGGSGYYAHGSWDTGWTVTSITDNGNYRPYAVDLDVDSSDLPHIVMYDVYEGDLIYVAYY